MDAALAQADKTAKQPGLARKEARHLCLLSEGMLNMICSIIGQPEGQFWIESSERGYQLHLKTVALMDAVAQAAHLSRRQWEKRGTARYYGETACLL